MKPIYVDFLLTPYCNFKCSFCSASAPNKKSQNVLKYEEIIDILKQLDSLEVMRVAFEGGELFLREDIFEILKFADLCNFEYYINTNGSFLTKEVIEKLKETRVSRICISIDGPNEIIHDSIRGYKGAFNIATTAIKNLIKEGIDVDAIITLSKLNYKYLYDTFYFLKTIGIKKVAIMLLATVGENNKDLTVPFSEWEKLLKRISLDKLNNQLPIDLRIVATSEAQCQWEIFLPLKETPELYELWTNKFSNNESNDLLACTAGKRNFAIDGCGNVYGCSLMVSLPELKAGNIRENSLKNIWENSIMFNELRKLSIKNISGSCKECEYLIQCKAGCRACSFNFNKNILDSNYRCPLTK